MVYVKRQMVTVISAIVAIVCLTTHAVAQDIGGFESDGRPLNMLANEYKSLCFYVKVGQQGLFAVSFMALRKDYSCMADKSACNIKSLEVEGATMSPSEYCGPGEHPKCTPWSELCSAPNTNAVWYHTDKRFRNKYFYNISGRDNDFVIGNLWEDSFQHQGNHYMYRYGQVGTFAMPLDARVVFNQQPTAIKRKKGTNLPGANNIEVDDQQLTWVCAMKREGNFTSGHIFGLTWGGPDNKTNCHWERQIVNQHVKSEQIEKVYNRKDINAYGFRVLEISNSNGVPYAKKFLHYIELRDVQCHFLIDQDIEPYYTHSCSSLSISFIGNNMGFFAFDVLKDGVGLTTQLTMRVVNIALPEFLAKRVESILDTIVGLYVLPCLENVNLFGWMRARLAVPFRRLIGRTSNNAAGISLSFESELPGQYKIFKATLELAVAKYLAHEDVMLVLVFSDSRSIDLIADALKHAFEEDSYTINVHSMEGYSTLGIGTAVNVVTGAYGPANLKMLVQNHKKWAADVTTLSVFFIEAGQCQADKQCPDTYEQQVKGLPSCKEKEFCYIAVPRTHYERELQEDVDALHPAHNGGGNDICVDVGPLNYYDGRYEVPEPTTETTPEPTKQPITERFNMLDTNGDGLIDATEMTQFFWDTTKSTTNQTVRYQSACRQVAEVLFAYDTDQDMAISVGEFQNLLDTLPIEQAKLDEQQRIWENLDPQMMKYGAAMFNWMIIDVGYQIYTLITRCLNF